MKQFIKDNKVILALFFAGLLVQLIYHYNYAATEWVISPMLTYMNLVSLLLIGLSFFLFSAKRKRSILANLFLFGVLILMVETVCFVLLDSPEKYKKDFGLPFLPEEHVSNNIGTVPYSDSIYHSVLVNGNDTVYDVKYAIDAYWKRITPNYDSTKSKHALFFGCSIAYGSGLHENETFPYYFQELSGNYNAYNFSYPGYGTHQMLARLQFQDLTEQVTEKDGIAFYIFFDDHINRSIGSMNTYVSWGSGGPYYYMDGNKLVRNKLFKNGRYYTSKMYELLYQTSVVQYFNIDFPLKLKHKHIDLSVEMILASKNEYRNQFGNDDFYVILYPTYQNISTQDYEYFKTALKAKKIKYIDLQKFITYGPEHTLGGDPHPNANTNKILVEELINQLNLKK